MNNLKISGSNHLHNKGMSTHLYFDCQISDFNRLKVKGRGIGTRSVGIVGMSFGQSAFFVARFVAS
jgi:hypothetical protein